MLNHYKLQKTVVAEPVTPANFAEFGGVISSAHQLQTVQSSSANYGTATKLFQVSPVVNTNKDAQANLNLFRCSPPMHLIDDHTEDDGGCTYHSKVLERHPFSTQTFIPMGRPRDEFSYMVIVAPPDPADPQKLPKIDEIAAFTVKGDQAITYGAGVWHAPMIALGDTTDFAVLIHETGEFSVDTEEVSLDEVEVEYTTVEPKAVPKRKPQSAEEFAEQQKQYTGPPDPTKTADVASEEKAAVGDPRFDTKQIKYTIEREYFQRNYGKVVELVGKWRVEGKLQKELDEIGRRAQEKLDQK